MNEEEIIRSIKNYLNQGNKVSVDWDGGTDCLFFNMSIGQNIKSTPVEIQVSQYLEHVIVEKLSIPTAGPPYDIGQGEVFIDNNNSVILRFSSRIHEDTGGYGRNGQGELVSWNEYDETEVLEATYLLDPLQLDDPFDMEKYLHRLEILLVGEFDAQFNTRSWIDINIIHGDKMTLKSKANRFYQKQINIVLDTLISKYKAQKQAFQNVYIEGTLQIGNQITFKVIEGFYSKLILHKEKEIILID